MSAVLTSTDIDALADAVAVRMVRFASPVLTVSEAMAYVGKRSTSAFGRWCEDHRVVACAQGRYARTKLDQALNKEAKRCAAKRKPVAR